MGLSEGFLAVLNFVFVDLWHFFTAWYIPGTTVTPAAWALASLVLVKVIQIIRVLYGIHSGDQDIGGKGGK